MRVEYGSGYLDPIPSSTVSLGQLPVTTDNAVLVATKIKTNTSEPGQLRDDTLLFNRTDGTIVETSAHHDGTRFTYWWGYTKATPTQTGWPARQDAPFALICCRLADKASFSPDKAELNRILIERGTGGARRDGSGRRGSLAHRSAARTSPPRSAASRSRACAPRASATRPIARTTRPPIQLVHAGSRASTRRSGLGR